MFCSAVLGVALYRLSADTNFLVLSFWVFFLCCSVTMLCQYCVVWVVWNVLKTSCCSYVSSFLHFQGSAFQFQCMYAPPHPVKKCVVLCVRGLLCFVDPSLGPSSPDAPFRNIVLRPSVPKLFAMLLDKFHIGLWSSMTKLKLFPLLRHILPPAVMKTLSFIFSRKTAMISRTTLPVTKCVTPSSGSPPLERCAQRIKSFLWMSALSQ